MNDREARDLERRVLAGDATALAELRVVWWRLGPPPVATTTGEGPWKFGSFAPKIRVRPTLLTPAKEVLSLRAQNAIWRLIPDSRAPNSAPAWLSTTTATLGDVAERLSARDILFSKNCGVTTLREIESVLELAGLRLRSDG